MIYENDGLYCCEFMNGIPLPVWGEEVYRTNIYSKRQIEHIQTEIRKVNGDKKELDFSELEKKMLEMKNEIFSNI